jgi:hypothetical protein
MGPRLLALLLAGNAPTAPLVTDWSVKLPEWTGRELVLAANDEALFFDADDSVHQLLLSSGKLLHKYKKEEFCQTLIDIQLFGNLAAFVCEFPRSEDHPSDAAHSILWVADTKSGLKLWSRPGVLKAPLAHADGRLFTIDGDSVVALDFKSGKELWKTKQPSPTHLAAGEGLLVALHAEGATALQPDSGKPIWTARLSGAPHAAPVVSAGKVFITLLETGKKGSVGALAAFSAQDGKSEWLREFPQESPFFPAFVTGDAVGIYTMGDEPPPGGLRLFSLSGEPRWVAPLRSDANGHDFRPAIQGNSLFDWNRDEKSQTGNDYQLVKVDMKTGAVRWRWGVSGDEKYLLARILIRGDRLIYSNMSRVFGMRLPRE